MQQSNTVYLGNFQLKIYKEENLCYRSVFSNMFDITKNSERRRLNVIVARLKLWIITSNYCLQIPKCKVMSYACLIDNVYYQDFTLPIYYRGPTNSMDRDLQSLIYTCTHIPLWPPCDLLAYSIPLMSINLPATGLLRVPGVPNTTSLSESNLFLCASCDESF